MSIFGQLDAASISSNPFLIEQGTYNAVISKAEFRTREDKPRQFILEYTIDDENSSFNAFKIQKYYNLVDEKMTAEDFAMLPPSEQQTLKRNLANLKKDLCGNEANAQQIGLAINPNDLNDPEWDPSVLMGTSVTIGIVNFGENKERMDVRWVNKNDA